MDKYKILYDNKIEIYDGIYLYRIQALKDFDDVKAGDIGGYVQSEKNLYQEGNCWIYDNAIAYNNSSVIDNAKIKDNVILSDNAVVMDDAVVKDAAYIFGNSHIMEKTQISGYPHIDDFSVIKNATISDYVEIAGNTVIDGNVIIKDMCRITDSRILAYDQDEDYPDSKIIIDKRAWVEDCEIRGYDIVISCDCRDSEILDNAKIYSYLRDAKIGTNGCILNDDMYTNISDFRDCLFNNGSFYIGIDKQVYFEGLSSDRMPVSEYMKDRENWEACDIDITYKILDLVKMIFEKKCGIEFNYPSREEIGL